MKMMSENKQKNLVLGILGIVMGAVSTSMGGYLMTMADTEKAVSQKSMVAYDAQCKKLSTEMGFEHIVKNKDTTTFYREIYKADDAYLNLISMQSFIMNCQAKTLVEACIGWDCDSVDEVSEYRGMPMVFTMTNNYKAD